MSMSSFYDYYRLKTNFNKVGTDPVRMVVATDPALADWNSHTHAAGINPSKLCNAALYYGSLRRIAASYALQTVLIDSNKTAHELPIFTPVSRLIGSTIPCEVTRRTATQLDYALQLSTTPSDNGNDALQIIHEVATILSHATTVPGDIQFASVIAGAYLFRRNNQGWSHQVADRMPIIDAVRTMPPFLPT